MSKSSDWNAQAKLVANQIVSEYYPTPHDDGHDHGACPLGYFKIPGVNASAIATVVFGNDGYGWEDRAKREVAATRRFVAERGWTELGFGTSDADDTYEDDHTWVMLVDGDHVADLKDA